MILPRRRMPARPALLLMALAAPPVSCVSEFEAWFNQHKTGPIVHKAQHYFDVYQRHFAPVRQRAAAQGRAVRMMEMGVQSGGSLEMWKSFFGESLELHGLDINPATRRFHNINRNITMHLGNMFDRVFMRKVARQVEGVDIIIDDASHHSLDIKHAFQTLYQCVASGGVYLVEDLQTNYWYNHEFREGYGANFTFIEYTKTLIDQLNAWSAVDTRFQNPAFKLAKNYEPDEFTRTTTSIHYYDGVVVFEKGSQPGPFVDRMAGSKLVGFSALEHKRPPGTPEGSERNKASKKQPSGANRSSPARESTTTWSRDSALSRLASKLTSHARARSNSHVAS